MLNLEEPVGWSKEMLALARTVTTLASSSILSMINPFLAENLPVARWLGGWLYPQPTTVQIPDLTLVFLI